MGLVLPSMKTLKIKKIKKKKKRFSYSGKAGKEDLNLFGRWGGHLLKEIKGGLVLALHRPKKQKKKQKKTPPLPHCI
jgi:hypothetical protein